MSEFALIDAIVAALGDASSSSAVRLGPGDDAAVIAVPPGHELVASIDTLVPGVHFPLDAPAVDVGFRALSAALSDLAAMAATPSYVLVSLTLPDRDAAWATELARGMAEAAGVYSAPIVGGNLTRGPLSIAVSVHGITATGESIQRSGAKPGDGVFVSGPLGGSHAALRRGFTEPALNARYYRPPNRTTLAVSVRGIATSAIDVSDGLLADAQHLATASAVALRLESAAIPVFPGATLEDALADSDDYELLLTAPDALPGCVRIGEVAAGGKVFLDGVERRVGYDHFA